MGYKSIRMRVELRDVAPTVWRELVVPAKTTLEKFHRILQDVMGWTNSHLYQFQVRDTSYTQHDLADDLGQNAADTTATRLADLELEVGESLSYMYDFGDGWEHDVTVLELDRATHAPECLDGARACPPEDCGGAPGYENLVACLTNPAHPEREEMLEWLGKEFDPSRFDIEEINSILRGS